MQTLAVMMTFVKTRKSLSRSIRTVQLVELPPSSELQQQRCGVPQRSNQEIQLDMVETK